MQTFVDNSKRIDHTAASKANSTVPCIHSVRRARVLDRDRGERKRTFRPAFDDIAASLKIGPQNYKFLVLKL